MLLAQNMASRYALIRPSKIVWILLHMCPVPGASLQTGSTTKRAWLGFSPASTRCGKKRTCAGGHWQKHHTLTAIVVAGSPNHPSALLPFDSLLLQVPPQWRLRVAQLHSAQWKHLIPDVESRPRPELLPPVRPHGRPRLSLG